MYWFYNDLTIYVVAGIAFKKCGMILTCLEPKENHVYDMFKDMQHVEISDALMDFLEAIYLKYGKTKIALGASLMLNRT